MGRHRGRERRVERVLRLLVARPVEVQSPLDGFAFASTCSGTDTIASPGGAIRAFCEPDTTTSIPHSSVSSGTAPSEDRGIDDEGRAAHRLLERAHVGDDAGRRVRVLAEHDLGSRPRGRPRRPRPDPGARPTRIGSPAHRGRAARRSRATARRGTRGSPTVTRSPGPQRLAAADSIAPLPEAVKRSTSEIGAEDVLEPTEHARVDLAKVSAAVVDDRLRACREHGGRDGRRAGREEVPLLHAWSVASPNLAGERPLSFGCRARLAAARGPARPRHAATPGQPGSCHSPLAAAAMAGAPRWLGRLRVPGDYLAGEFLPAPLLGVGSLQLMRRRWAAPLGFLWTGVAVGLTRGAGACTVRSAATTFREPRITWTCCHACSPSPRARSGRPPSSSSPLSPWRRPFGNLLLLAAVGAAAAASALTQTAVAAAAACFALAAALLYAAATR